ncbi:ribosomal subunit interface protein [Cutibacterium acnes JCM 18920]|nr:ribosomal subunit interface protein [Cutibacterium acnes JCM 18920]
MEVTGDSPIYVKEKIFQAVPLTLAQALDEMELVGHDFFLYLDQDSKRLALCTGVRRDTTTASSIWTLTTSNTS